MKKPIAISLACAAVLYAASACAGPQGEMWRVVAQAEIKGLRFEPPELVQKFCLPRGSANDPRYVLPGLRCKTSDLQTVANKTAWKATCIVGPGRIMRGSGNIMTATDRYSAVVHLTGKVLTGKTMDSTYNYQGTNLGTSCDASEMTNRVNTTQQGLDREFSQAQALAARMGALQSSGK